MSDEIRTALERAIAEARNLGAKPPNESCTCEWVILPVLWAAGYAKHEIISQGAMPGVGFPDYTILPSTPWTWYLEAKEWKKTLENGADAVQALNYANAQGRRWVVLSNGRQWLLFDNHLTEVEAPQRLVARADLDDPGFADFMMALSKPSVTADGLGHYVTRSRVRFILDQQLGDKDSPVVKAITSVLKKLGVAGVQRADVAKYFSKPVEVPEHETDEPAEHRYTLSGLMAVARRLSGRTPPAEVVFPDGSSTPLRIWADLAHQVVGWLTEHTGLPQLPFSGCPRSKRWFINREKSQPSGKRHSVREIATPNGPIYVEVSHWGPYWFLEHILALCTAVGEPPEGFVVKLAKPLASE